MHTPFSLLPLARTCLLIAIGGLLPARAATEQPQSLTRYTPADAGLFVEIRGSEDLLVALTEPRVWTSLAELAGQPASAADAATWRTRIRQAIGMEPNEAIHKLFARGVAFVGEGALRSQDAVVLCRPAAGINIDDLLKQWGAKPLADQSLGRVYELRENVGVGAENGVLIFGDASRPRGMFRRALAFASGTTQPTLADDPDLRALLRRVPADPDGILFARLNAARRPVGPLGLRPPEAGTSATQPTFDDAAPIGRLELDAQWTAPALPELPGPLRGASNVLLALHRDGRLLHLTAVGDAKIQHPPPTDRLVPLVRGLPQRTLVAWGGHVDYAALMQSLEKLPASHIGQFLLRMRDQIAVRFEQHLLSPTCIAVGAARQGRGDNGAPPLPAIAVLLTTTDPRAALEAFESLAVTSTSFYNLLALQRELPTIRPLETRRLTDATIHLLDLELPIANLTGGFIADVQLCWAIDGEVLIVATNVDWLQQILASRHGRDPGLSEVFALAKRPPATASESVVVAQIGPLSDLGTLWLEHLRNVAPETLTEKWWRGRQPGGQRVQLGINITPQGEPARLCVTTVRANAPAAGLLQTGDYLVGIEGVRITAGQPFREVQAALENRPAARWVNLLIERDGVEMPVRVPLPFLNPVEVLQRWVAIGRVVQRVLYCDDLPSAAGPRGFLTIELREDAAPLFNIADTPTSAPATQPTSTPATQPTSAPAVQPTSAPATQPTSAPAIQPTTAPTSPPGA